MYYSTVLIVVSLGFASIHTVSWHKSGFTGEDGKPQWHSARQCHHLAKVKVSMCLQRAEVPPRELISPASGWQVVAPPSTIVTFTSCHASCVLDAVIMHTGRVSCHHLIPSTNNVWTLAGDKAFQQPRKEGSMFFSYTIYGFRFSNPIGATWF